MPEENEEKTNEEQSQENPGGAAENDGAPTMEELNAIKADLEAERQAKAAVEATLAEKDAAISELQTQLATAQTGLEQSTTDLTQAKDAYTAAVGKYLDLARTVNPTIPGDVIAGSTIEEIDASIQKATSIAQSVKNALEAEAKATKVPAGAPERSTISLEAMSPKEKIAAGIQHKGGE